MNPSDEKNPASAPADPSDQDGKLPFKEKLAYAAAHPVDLMAGGAVGALTNPIFVILMGVSPSVISLVSVIYRVWDAFTDIGAGWISDNARTRWGRRRPFIFVGAIVTGVWMPVIWFFPQTWPTALLVVWMVGAWMVRDVFASMWNVPYQCLLLEMTSSSKERTNISALRSYFGGAGALVVGWVWFLTQLAVFNDASGKPDIILGARWVTAGFGLVIIVLGLLPFFFVKERFYHQASKQPKVSLRDNFRFTFTNRPFILLAVFTLVVTVGTSAKAGLAFYTKLYHVFGGDQKLAATVAGVESTVTLVVGLMGIPIFQWISKRFGNKPTLILAMAIVSTASLSTIFTYTPTMPYLTVLTAILLAPATSGMWLMMPPMLGDIVDYDELRTSERREGAFSSIYSWILKMGYSVGVGISGPLVEFVGFRVAAKAHQPAEVILTMRILLAAIPATLVGLGILVLWFYPLNRAKMREVNAELETRRGKV